MARVRCAMMQKDEELLVGAWISYYSYLFGIENLVIFDNGSTTQSVIRTLRQFEAAGGRVLWHLRTTDDWHAKGQLIEMVIKRWDLQADYDFAIPLDCDEFLALYTPDGLSCRRTDIHDYLDSLIGTEGAFGLDTSCFNVPDRPDWFYPTRGAKRFFAADTLKTLDHGFHIAEARLSDAVLSTRLTHLHYHNKPYRIAREHAARKLASFVDVNDPAALRAYRGPNEHVVRHLTTPEAEYLPQFENLLRFRFRGLSHTLGALGHASPLFPPPADLQPDGHQVPLRFPRSDDTVMFDADAYITRNLDVGCSRFHAFEHYLTVGHVEGRMLHANL